MPRQMLPITRPPCPFGHKGDVWLDGFYAKGTDLDGAIETVFDATMKRLWTRRFVFRNRARLELALRLMLLDLEGSADELRYRQAIRKALLAGGGQPARSRRSLGDRGGSSIHAEVRDVIARTAANRVQNAMHAKASYARKKAARISRTRPRAPRRLRATRSP